MIAAHLLAVLAAAVLAAPAAGTAFEGPRLVGTWLVPGQAGSAVFEDASGRQVARRVGDLVAPGLRLAAVRRGAVDLVDDAGRRLTLRTGRGGGRVPEPVDGVRLARAAPVDAGRLAHAGPVDRDGHPLHVRHGSRLARAHEEGRFAGLRLVGGPPDTPLVRAGLRPGDLIVAVDGRELDGDDPQLVPSLLEALDAADAESPLLVEARRGDEVIRVAVGEP
ncbi:MAG TPA: hypothetical protein VIM86_14665 [Thermodesulfobacteriota bacterium]